MHVVFRADASIDIGTGHVMRCLTLADALRERGADCRFISRDHVGNCLGLIRARGFDVVELPRSDHAVNAEVNTPDNKHAAWLGADWREDAEQTLHALGGGAADWLIVDHYALDERWEGMLRSVCRRLMVIDDLADRPHECDVLLDQNLGRTAQDYSGLVPRQCQLFAGPKYALLRPEFAAVRAYSLERRKPPSLKQLLVSMGGVDKPNATGQVLEALKQCSLPDGCNLVVVMGQAAPWLESVQETARDMPWPTDVRVNVQDMAQLMADSDLAIGAAGGSSWERCCLGLPAILVVLAENQWGGANALQDIRAARLIGGANDPAGLRAAIAELSQTGYLAEMGQAASEVTDGKGVGETLAALRGDSDATA